MVRYVPDVTTYTKIHNIWQPFVLKGKAIPLQDWTGPEGSRRLRFPDFKTIGTWRWKGCQLYALATFTPRKYSWYSFLWEDESTPGPQRGRKDYVNEKFQWHHRKSNPATFRLVAQCLNQLRHRVPQPFVLDIKIFYCSYLATQIVGSLLCSQRPMVGSYPHSNRHARTVLHPSCYWIRNVVCTWSGCSCCIWKKSYFS